MSKYKQLSIGIDQSYKNCGVSISADGQLLKVTHIKLEQCKSNTDKRRLLKAYLDNMLKAITPKADSIVCIIERIRLHSQGFLNIDYIKAMGALNAVIIDIMDEYDISVYSVDTRCWKSQVIGTSKPKDNNLGVPKEKYPTVEWCIKQGFENSVLRTVKGKKKKGTFARNGIRYMYDNDACDSSAISMFYFVGNKEKLKQEH
nr:MAG TPA: HOLLIDAY JUNCTION RESOLVASE [Caudoviricetes sp.]